ncbi:vWA domain-containing protein [Haliea atlantica]
MGTNADKNGLGLGDVAGYSLIATAMMILAVGFMMPVGLHLHHVWKEKKRQTEILREMTDNEHALRSFMAEHGRYPCPAPLDAQPDTGTFGREVSDDCTASDHPGTFRADGRGGRMVRIGALPTRSMNIADEDALDPWGHRYVYAVTELYATEEAPFDKDMGAITVVDGDENSASSSDGNLVHLLLSQGPDPRGAYNRYGNLVEPCAVGTPAGENCEFDATFANTVSRSYGDEVASFTHRLTYQTVSLPTTCTERIAEAVTGDGAGLDAETFPMPGDIAYLVDTSGSMGSGETTNCPPEMKPFCTRIDIARWALRRVVPARIKQQKEMVESGEPSQETELTGFITNQAIESRIRSSLRNISIDDPDRLEPRIQRMCPSGSTPLGAHIGALADRLGNGTDERPNAVLVISDGLSNMGINPINAAHRIASTYPNLQVHIIDVKGNPSLARVAEITGGKYFLARQSELLLSALNTLSGICTDFVPPEPPKDLPGCGSNGGWWR